MKLLALGLLILFLIPLIPVQAVTITTSTSQPLTPILQTQQKVHTVNPGQFAQDLGSNTMQTTPKAFSFYRPGGNFSIGAVALTVNGQSIALSNPNGGLFPQGLFNSTTTEYLYDQTVAIFPNMYHAHLELYLNHISGTYNWETILKGSEQINGFPVAGNETLLLQFTNPQSLAISDCNPVAHTVTINGTLIHVRPCTKQLFGNIGITLGCSSSNGVNGFSYNNSTLVESFSVASNFSCDPIAVDSSANVAWNGGNTKSVTLSTSSSPDVIYVVVTGLTFSTFAVGNWATSDTVSLSWTNGRVYLQDSGCPGGNCGTEFTACAIASGTLSSDSITITITGHNLFGGQLSAYGISGANTSGCSSGNSFDSNGAIPCSAVQDGTAQGRCTISTSNANDMLIGGAWNDGGQGLTAPTSPASWPDDFNNVVNGRSNDAAHLVVSSTQSSVNIDWTNWQSNNGVVFVDAIKASAATATQPIIITTLAAGAPSATISISGCAVSNSTFTANGFKHTYSSVTASCTITLTEPADGSNTRYRWNISPKPTVATSITFSTCAGPGTCSTYSNSTYYQLSQTHNYATPLTPSTWDGSFSWNLKGTRVGTANQQTNCNPNTIIGGGQQDCQAVAIWFDYNLPVQWSTPIGNTWIAQAPSSFTDTTGGNTRNVNYIQSKGGEEYNYLWLFLIPLGLILAIFLKKRL